MNTWLKIALVGLVLIAADSFADPRQLGEQRQIGQAEPENCPCYEVWWDAVNASICAEDIQRDTRTPIYPHGWPPWFFIVNWTTNGEPFGEFCFSISAVQPYDEMNSCALNIGYPVPPGDGSSGRCDLFLNLERLPIDTDEFNACELSAIEIHDELMLLPSCTE